MRFKNTIKNSSLHIHSDMCEVLNRALTTTFLNLIGYFLNKYHKQKNFEFVGNSILTKAVLEFKTCKTSITQSENPRYVCNVRKKGMKITTNTIDTLDASTLLASSILRLEIVKFLPRLTSECQGKKS